LRGAASSPERARAQAHEIYYPTLVTYGEVVSNEAVGEGVAQVMMGKSLMFLQDLLIYVKRYGRRHARRARKGNGSR